ncbi:hypothetical protein GH714_036253 [Hevea brasiliensis]|uniref:Glycylpeptide N-tetradecanoyltransferase n=1 Tax=Hevea brasiliensis TaxID=3981 RepID=A0A6A6NEM1_HEVBR|nr:hypothetical protein GH714_036253 [Hevea brasiliensis]
MVDSNASSGSPEETVNPNSEGNAPSENDLALDTLARKVQESLTLGKRHKFWETQPVGQFKDIGDTSLAEGLIEPPTPLSEVKQEPYNLPTFMNGLRAILILMRCALRLGARMTMSRTIKLYKLPESTATPGFRKMKLHDVPAVTRLIRNYLSQFAVAPDLMKMTFYTLPSSILGNQNYSALKAAYSYYNISTKTPLVQLMNDALIVAKHADYDVFNALDVMQNESFLKELKFGPGDGKLHYYLYNYRIKQILKPAELGLVLL